jgi:RimJ/RimL family protein N-acetyltransferase
MVLPEEWPAVKELRLKALRDPAAPIAFLETHEAAVERPDEFWIRRAAGGGDGQPQAQMFVAQAPDGRLTGSVTLFLEGPDSPLAAFDGAVQQRQGHLVGVYVTPEQRGTGLIGQLIAAALEWAWGDGDLPRVRLFVHERNGRAAAAYRKAGFAYTGDSAVLAGVEGGRELEMLVERPA